MSRGARATVLVAALGLAVGGAPLLLGPPGGDDAYYHAMRAQQEAHCWLAGVPFPRWYPDLNAGLGGPEPRAYPIVPLFLHAVLALAGNDGVLATSLATALVPVLAGLVMLAAARRRGAGEGASFLAALAWTAAPYLVVALHERAALAEGWALAVLPAVLALLLPPAPAAGRAGTPAALAFAALAATQLPLAFMAGLVVAGAHLATRSWRAAARAAVAMAAGLGLAAVSWLPNLDAVSSLAGERLIDGEYGWRAHLLPFPAMADQALAQQLVVVLGGVVLAAAVLLAAGRGAARGLAGAALAVALLSTPLAAWAYRWAPGFAFLQFPWRWLGMATCLAALALAETSRRKARAGAALALLAPLLLTTAWGSRLADGMPLRPGDPGGVVARAATRYGVPPILPSLPAYLPRGVDLLPALRRLAAVRASVGAPTMAGPRVWRWELVASPGTPVVLPLLAAPGWRVTVDARTHEWRPIGGMVGVDLPAGVHEVCLAQTLSFADLSGMVLGAVSLIALLAWSRARRPAP